VCPFIHAVAEADTSECPAPVLNLTIRVHIQISMHIQIFRVDVSILGMEMMDCTLTAEYFDGHHRVDPLPPHVTWIEIRSDVGVCPSPELKHRMRCMHQEAAVQFQSDFHIVRFSQFSNFLPVWHETVLPLPFLDFGILLWPWGHGPVH